MAIQDKFNKPNTIYKITKDYNLAGSTLTIPSGCTLDFQGGSFSNGTLTGNGSDLIADRHSIIFNDVIINGTWKVPIIYDSWFNFNTAIGTDNSVNLQNLCNLTSDTYNGTIEISSKPYYVTLTTNNSSILNINSNTILVLNGSIILNPNSFSQYRIISVLNKSNILIKGGTIIGDVTEHTGTGESGHGIGVLSSSNISVEGVTIKKCWGDGIYLGQVDEGVLNNNIRINNCISDSNRRQGLSIISGSNILVTNSVFSNTGISNGTPPMNGIDIEPNFSTQVLKNIIISKCSLVNNGGGALVLNYKQLNSNYENVENVQIQNVFADRELTFNSCFNTSISNSTFNKLYFNSTNLLQAKNVYINNCIFTQEYQSTVLKYSPYINYYGNQFLASSNNVFYRSVKWSEGYLKLTLPLFRGVVKISVAGYYNSYDASLAKDTYYILSNIGGNTAIKGATYYKHGILDSLILLNNDIRFSDPYVEGDKVAIIIAAHDVSNTLSINLRIEIQDSEQAYHYDSTIINDSLIKTEVITDISQYPDIKYFNIPESGITSTTSRISNFNAKVGSTYFDTTLGKSFVWNGTEWVNMDGSNLNSGGIKTINLDQLNTLTNPASAPGIYLVRATSNGNPVMGIMEVVTDTNAHVINQYLFTNADPTDVTGAHVDANRSILVRTYNRNAPNITTPPPNTWGEWSVLANNSLTQLRVGTTEQRPSLTKSNTGYQYFDTTLNKDIVYDGSEWKNMDGTPIANAPLTVVI